MCGICGIISNTISNNEKELFLQLLFLSSFRGMHSTGVFAIQTTHNNTRIQTPFIKDTGNSLNFLVEHESEFDKEIWTTNTSALIGHTRHATKGDITKENAHPFDFPNIIGVHNGQISPHPIKTKKTYETDSEALFASIEAIGIESTLSKLYRNDSYALVYVDKKKKTLNIIRNDKRPLAICTIGSGGTLLWASEATFLRFVLDRDRTKYSDIVTLKPNQMLAFDITSSNPARAFTIKELDIKDSDPVTTYNGRQVIWPHKDTNIEAVKQLPFRPEVHVKKDITLPPIKTNIITTNFDHKPKIDTAPVRFYKILNKGFTPEEYQAKLEAGCTWCCAQCDIDDDKVEWLNEFEYLCNECKIKPEVEEFRPFYANNTIGR